MVKKRKLNSNHFPLANDGTNVGFCSMDDGCINNIFEWLSIEDFCRLKVTCKRLYLLANEHCQRTYGRLFAVYNMYKKGVLENRNPNSFASVPQNICIWEFAGKLSELGQILNNNVKYIEIWSSKLNVDSNDMHLKNKLQNVESIHVRCLSDSLLQLFTNLEYIVYLFF